MLSREARTPVFTIFASRELVALAQEANNAGPFLLSRNK
jgi:hypothetical protein